MNEGFERIVIDDLKSRELIYVKRYNRFISDVTNYSHILSSIKSHDFGNFKIEDKSYCIEITPDDRFLELISLLNDHIDLKINIDKIILFLTKDKGNLIDMETHLPDILKGSSIGYKLYKLVISKFGYISSDRRASDDALNLWYNLLQDNDLYCITSNYFSYAIDKTINDSELKNIIDNVKLRNDNITDVIYDDDLKEYYYKITSTSL